MNVMNMVHEKTQVVEVVKRESILPNAGCRVGFAGLPKRGVVMKKERTLGAFLALAFMLTLSSGPRAQENGAGIHPPGWADLYAGTMIDFGAVMAFGGADKDIFAFVPDLKFQFGTGTLAVGLEWGFSVADVDGGDTDIFLEAFAINFKLRHCIDGAVQFCFGTRTQVSVNPFQVDGPGESLSSMMGWVTRHMQYSEYYPELVAVTPLGILEVSHGMLFAQVVFGVSVLIPYATLEEGVHREDDAEAALLWGFSGGLVVAELVAASLGMKGYSTVSLPDDETFFSIDLSFRLMPYTVSPYLVLSLPVAGDYYEDILDIVLTVGVTAEF
jgi:hypothetical protein